MSKAQDSKKDEKKKKIISRQLADLKEKAKEIFTAVLQIDPQNQLATQGLVEANK